MFWYPCGCCRYCENCQGEFAPVEWQVDISGLSNSDPPECANCADLNGTYVVASAGYLPFGTCVWEYVLPAPICGVVKVRLTIGLYSFMPPWWLISVKLLDAAGQDVMFAQKTSVARPDCMGMNAESLGALNEPWGGTTCSESASAVSITALRPCEPS